MNKLSEMSDVLRMATLVLVLSLAACGHAGSNCIFTQDREITSMLTQAVDWWNAASRPDMFTQLAVDSDDQSSCSNITEVIQTYDPQLPSFSGDPIVLNASGMHDGWSVLTHEIGHNLGLVHNLTNPRSPMWPSAGCGQENFCILDLCEREAALNGGSVPTKEEL